MKSIVKIESTREFTNSDKPIEYATKYYISSLLSGAKEHQQAIRLHWGIENKLHWVLDVAFGEDASRKRMGNASQNFSILSKIALNLLKNETSERQGIKGKRLKAAYDQNYLIKVLNIKVCVCPVCTPLFFFLIFLFCCIPNFCRITECVHFGIGLFCHFINSCSITVIKNLKVGI